MIDMGKHHGEQVWYTEGRSIKQLIEDGEIVALPDSEDAIVFKRKERCTPLELMAAFTLEETKEIYRKIGS